MKPDPKFTNCPQEFWANVRIISQELGYTERTQSKIKVYSAEEIRSVMKGLGLEEKHLLDGSGKETPFAKLLLAYFEYHAEVLNTKVEPLLMDKKRAKKEFLELKKKLRPSCPIPMNKQKGEKKTPAYLTGIVNMLIENCKGPNEVDYDPRSLTIITRNGAPLRTLSRRIDGCFPGIVNPVAVWEIKEYYNTTTFGSRVADAIYETYLDGLELKELKDQKKTHVKHYLIIDDHYTWWDCGRSYLCRIIDLLNMGFLDEALFGHEVIERLPSIVKEWVEQFEKSKKASL